METIILFTLFIILLLLGIPISVVLGISSVLVIIVFDLGKEIIGQNFYASISSFPLIAIPFFILAGSIMKKACIAEKISELFSLLVRNVTGGMVIVAILTSIFWGSVSGSGPATTAAVGFILISAMTKQGYDKHFAAAAIASSADLSIVIPPSIAFIIYGNLTVTSITKLFLAGIIPGVLIGILLVITGYIISHKRNYKFIQKKAGFFEILNKLKESFFALCSPVIILGGIYSGIFTPTEAAVIAVFYALFISIVIYKNMTLSGLFESFIESAIITAVIMFIVAMAGIFSWTTSILGIIDTFSNYLINYSNNPYFFIIAVNLIVLSLGMILDAISIMYIIIPLTVPVMTKLNINPVWFGVIFICGLAIGQATPPVGVNLFTAASLTDGNIDKIAKSAIPFVIAAIVGLIIISFFPGLSLMFI